jgi:hypothetical protein
MMSAMAASSYVIAGSSTDFYGERLLPQPEVV